MRVASLVPSTTEIVAAMGLTHRLAARTHECDYPAAVSSVPTVTSDLLPPGLSAAEIDQAVAASMRDSHTIYALDAPALLNAMPDIVLTQATCAVCAVDAAAVQAVTCTMPGDARIMSFDPHTIDDVIAGCEDIGRAIGAPRQGLALRSHLQTRLDRLAHELTDVERPRVAMVEWPDPIFAPGHWVPDLIEAGGATSVFGSSGSPSTRSDLADLAGATPDIIVFAFCGFDLETTITHANTLLASPVWTDTIAAPVELYAMDGSGYVSRPGPRLIDAVESLAWALHRPHPAIRPAPGIIAHHDGSGWVDLG